MKNKVFILALLLTIVSISPTWAQSLPGNIWSSPTNTTSEGRFRSDADNFIRPDAYLNVDFDRWFGMVTFLANQDFAPVATMGFATRAAGVYIGAFYSGNMWTNRPFNSYTERMFIGADVPRGAEAGRVYNVYSSINLGGTGVPVNNFSVLIGVADMGFRLTFRTDYLSFDQSNIVSGNQLYRRYRMQRGYLAPQFAWSMARDLTSFGIRPYFTAEFIFHRSNHRTETAGPDINDNTGARILRSENRFEPIFSAGLGGFTFFRGEEFSASADLDYVLTLNIYNNDYSFVENGVHRIRSISGTYSPGTNPYMERSFISNEIVPSVSGSWSRNRLSLSFKLHLPLVFSSEDQNQMALTASGGLVNHGASNSISIFSIRQDLRLAMMYQIIPERLSMNAGARIQSTAINLQTTTQRNYNNGDLIDTRRIIQNSFGGPQNTFASRFSIGTTFVFTENLWVEANTGVLNNFGNVNTIDVFASGGLISFGSILAGLRF